MSPSNKATKIYHNREVARNRMILMIKDQRLNKAISNRRMANKTTANCSKSVMIDPSTTNRKMKRATSLHIRLRTLIQWFYHDPAFSTSKANSFKPSWLIKVQISNTNLWIVENSSRNVAPSWCLRIKLTLILTIPKKKNKNSRMFNKTNQNNRMLHRINRRVKLATGCFSSLI